MGLGRRSCDDRHSPLRIDRLQQSGIRHRIRPALFQSGFRSFVEIFVRPPKRIHRL